MLVVILYIVIVRLLITYITSCTVLLTQFLENQKS